MQTQTNFNTFIEFLKKYKKSSDEVDAFIEKNSVSKEAFRRSLDHLDDWYRETFPETYSSVLVHVVRSEIVDFRTLIDKHKKQHLLTEFAVVVNSSVFDAFIESDLVTNDDLRYLWEAIDTFEELSALLYNNTLVAYLLQNGIVSFQEFVDKYQNTQNHDEASSLFLIFGSSSIAELLAKNYDVSISDLKHLLHLVDEDSFEEFCKHDAILQKILKNFLLDTALVDKFNSIVQKTFQNTSYKLGFGFNLSYTNEDIKNVFDFIKFHQTFLENDDSEFILRLPSFTNDELLKLNEINRSIFDLKFTCSQIDEILELVSRSEKSRSILLQLIENNLLDTYDFETLKNLLTKDDKKKKTTLNF